MYQTIVINIPIELLEEFDKAIEEINKTRTTKIKRTQVIRLMMKKFTKDKKLLDKLSQLV